MKNNKKQTKMLPNEFKNQNCNNNNKSNKNTKFLKTTNLSMQNNNYNNKKSNNNKLTIPHSADNENMMTSQISPLPSLEATSSLTAIKKAKFTHSHQQWHSQHRHSLLTAFGFTVLFILFGIIPGFINAFDLDNEMNLKPTKYTEWSKNTTYLSSTEYNARGMQPLYDITHQILWFFVGEDPLPEGYIVVKDMDVEYGPKVENNEWGDLIKHYWPILLLVILVGLLVVAMPIIGFCFCCCRCAGACGGRTEPFDKKHDTCRRVFLGFLLILLATGMLFGVIIAFATNSIMERGIDGSTKAVSTGSDDARKFFVVTADHVDHVLVTNYKQLSDQLESILRETAAYIITKLEQKSMAVSLVYLTDFLGKLPDLREKLHHMKVITNELRVHASQLSDGLRGVKRDLLVMLTKCNVKACQDVLNRYEIGKLDANGIHYDQLPDVTEIIDNLDNLITENIASAGNRGRETLERMRLHLNKTIAQHTPQILDAIYKAGQRFQRASNEMRHETRQISNVIGNSTDLYVKHSNDFLHEYGPYRFYICLAACSVLLLILVCLVAALLCGICGKRPSGYGDDCCNKGSGSRFLMFAVAIIFLTFSALALVALIHFLVGLVSYRGICLPLKDPQNDEIFAEFDKSIDLNKVLYPSLTKGQSVSGNLPPFRISHVITACQANQTIYEVLNIHNRIDIHEINDYPTQYKINQTLSNLVNGIDFNESNIQILSDADKRRILELGESALKNFDSGQFIDNLNDTITKHSLTDIANQLRETAKKITSDDMKDVQVSLRNQALHLESYEQNLVIPMKNQSLQLINLARDLDQKLRYKERSFSDSIPLLVNEIERAQTFIHQEGRPFVRATAENLTRFFASEIDRYLSMVVNSVEKKIGLCEPLARVYGAGIVTVCNNIVDPMNGFWAGVFLCLVLFIPTLLVAVKLASLYQKSDPYPGPLVESEYLYDAYSEREPLPSGAGSKNKRRKNKDRRRREYYEDSVGSTSHGMPPAGSAGVRDTRYNDMAPKHWDGGPPRYQNPPMAPPASEYERPPPYYYPGATEQD